MITSRSDSSMSGSLTSSEANSSSGSSDQPRRRSSSSFDGPSSSPAVDVISADDRFTQAERRESDPVRIHGPADEASAASTPLRQRRLPASFWQEPNVPRRHAAVTSLSVNCDKRPGKVGSGYDGARGRHAARHHPGGIRTDSCCYDWNRMICYDILNSVGSPHHQSFSGSHSGTSPPGVNPTSTSVPSFCHTSSFPEFSSYFPGLQATSWTSSGVLPGCAPAAPLTPPSPSNPASFVGTDDVVSAYLRLCGCSASTPSYDVTKNVDGGNSDAAVDSMSCQLGRTLYYQLPAVLPSVRNLVGTPLIAAAASSEMTSCGAGHRTHRFHPYS